MTDENRKSDEEIEWEIFAHESQKRLDQKSRPQSFIEIWIPRIIVFSVAIVLSPIVFFAFAHLLAWLFRPFMISKPY